MMKRRQSSVQLPCWAKTLHFDKRINGALVPTDLDQLKSAAGCFRLSPGNRCEKGILAGVQVFAVTQNKLKTAEETNFCLYPGIPQPSGRPEVSGGIVNIAAIEERPRLHREKSSPINDFVRLRVYEDVIPA